MKLPPRVGQNPRKRDKRALNYARPMQANFPYMREAKIVLLNMALCTLVAMPALIFYVYKHA
jgi:hypothetical protein